MTTLAQRPMVAGLPRPTASVARAKTTVRLHLLASGDGWSLVAPDGRLVFQALGTHGRRQCLEYALAEGALAILS